MGRKTLIKIAVACVLVYAGLSFYGSRSVPPIFTVSSSIVLPASAEKSWEVLTDFAKYPQWNPYLPRVEGALKPGERISFTLVAETFEKPLDLTARLIEVRAPEEIYWEGTLGIRGLHDTRHVFRLEPMVTGSTRLVHFEEFRGVLALLLPERERRMAQTKRAFESMNNALQKRLADLN